MFFKSLKDHIYDYLSSQISEGKLKSNMKINENEICEELGVSRTPLKEALIELENDGLLERLPRKGFKVKAITTKMAKEKYTIIGVLDGLAAIQALNHLTKSDFFEMEMLAKRMELAVDEGDFYKYIQLQYEFHNVYINKCDNEELTILLSKLTKSFMNKTYYEKLDAESTRQLLHQTNQEHKKIIELMKEKNKESLESYIREVHWNPENANYQI